MGKITKAAFLEVVHDEVSTLFSGAGFAKREPATFWRPAGVIEHGLFIYPDSDFTRIHIPTGVHAPTLAPRFEYIDGGRYRSLLVSRWLGEFKPRFRRSDCYYNFTTLADLRDALARVHRDFVEQAEPWLDQIVTLDDVAREFHKLRIASEPDEQRPPDPFGWAQYGWILQEAGKPLEAKPWLELALDRFKVPTFFAKGIQIVPAGTPGARAIPQTPEERRAIELLEKDLGL